MTVEEEEVSDAGTNPYASPRPIGMPEGALGSRRLRPRIAVIIGSLNLAWSVPGVACVAVLIFVAFLRRRMAFELFPGGPVGNEILDWGSLTLAGLASLYAFVCLILEGMLIVSGVRLLQGRPSGRRLAVRYAQISLLAQLLFLSAAFVLTITMPARERPSFHLVEDGLALICVVAALAYPAAVLYLMTRPRLVADLDAYSSAAGDIQAA